MAYHYREPGFTRIEIGAVYVQSLHWYSYRYRLRRYNPATGICVLGATDGYVIYLSETDLSHYHLIQGKNHE
jgi:hypothetical protein